MKKKYWFFLVIMALVTACGSGPTDTGPEYYPPQTRILKIIVRPDTVAPADTATITCIIADSTNKRFGFYWQFNRYGNKGIPLGGIDTTYQGESVFLTYSNHIKWIAPEVNRGYLFGIIVDDGSTDSAAVTGAFSIFIKSK